MVDEEEPAAEAPATADDVAIIAEPSPVTPHAARRVPRDVVTSLRVAFGYDDVAQHKADGFDVSCCLLSADGGIEGDKEEMWKFHVMAATASVASLRAAAAAAEVAGGSSSQKGDEAAPPAAGDDGDAATPADADAAAPSDAGFGIEDVVWVAAPRGGDGPLPPAAPDGYTWLSEADLLGEGSEAETAVYLAVKRGPAPRLATVRMYCLPPSGGEEAEAADADAAAKACFPGREVVARAAPAALEALQGAPCGLLLEYLSDAALAAGEVELEEVGAAVASEAPELVVDGVGATDVGDTGMGAGVDMDVDVDVAMGAGVDLEASLAAASVDDGAPLGTTNSGDGLTVLAASWDGSAGAEGGVGIHASASSNEFLDHELDAIDRSATKKSSRKTRRTEEDFIAELEQVRPFP